MKRASWVRVSLGLVLLVAGAAAVPPAAVAQEEYRVRGDAGVPTLEAADGSEDPGAARADRRDPAESDGQDPEA